MVTKALGEGNQNTVVHSSGIPAGGAPEVPQNLRLSFLPRNPLDIGSDYPRIGIMARPRSQGEKALFWIGSSYRELLAFPERVKDRIGTALGVAQFGGKHASAKPWKGEGSGVLEVVENHAGDAYRAVYTV